MPGDPTLNDVLQEAYASASVDKVIIDTLSFYYDGLVNDDEQPDEVYLFKGENYSSLTEDGVPLLLARIEAGAARNAGQVVTFRGVPFALTLPPMTNEPVAAAQLSIDSVNREMHDLLEAAAKGGKAIEVTYRSYVVGLENDGPQSLPPRRFLLSGVTGNNASVQGRLMFLHIGSRAYPFDSYRPETFRTLQYA